MARRSLGDRHDADPPFDCGVGKAAKFLGVSVQTVRRWADSGYLESVRTPGGQRRFSREALQRLADRCQEDREGGVN